MEELTGKDQGAAFGAQPSYRGACVPPLVLTFSIQAEGCLQGVEEALGTSRRSRLSAKEPPADGLLMEHRPGNHSPGSRLFAPQLWGRSMQDSSSQCGVAARWRACCRRKIAKSRAGPSRSDTVALEGLSLSIRSPSEESAPWLEAFGSHSAVV